LGVFVVNITPDEGWVAFIGTRVEFEVFIEEKAAFFVRYNRASQSERKATRESTDIHLLRRGAQLHPLRKHE
jgi:hypothetical protein